MNVLLYILHSVTQAPSLKVSLQCTEVEIIFFFTFDEN